MRPRLEVEQISKAGVRKRAQRAVSLTGEKCSECGSTDSLERHHPDYSKPEEVLILCKKCHTEHDLAEGYKTPRRAPKACVVCGTMFAPTHSTNKTCKSVVCRAELGRRNANKRWHAGHTA